MNIYLLLFLAALYLDKSDNSKLILVLSTAVLIVNQVISILGSPSLLLSPTFLIKIISYETLYLFQGRR